MKWIKVDYGNPKYDYYEYHENDDKKTIWYKRLKRGEPAPTDKPVPSWI